MSNPEPAPVFRVDKFTVPPAARREFLARVRATHAVLRAQPGFVRDRVLERISGPGAFDFVTIVEWASAEALPPAAAAVAAAHLRTGFDRDAFLRECVVRADIANYAPLEV